MWLAPPLSVRVQLARSRCRTRRRPAPPTTRTPPSCRSRPGRSSASLRHSGCACGSAADGAIVATLRARRCRRSSRAGRCRCGSALASVSILKSDGLALVHADVGARNPGCDGSPAPVTSHSVCGFPGQRVLAHDRVLHGHVTRARRRRMRTQLDLEPDPEAETEADRDRHHAAVALRTFVDGPRAAGVLVTGAVPRRLNWCLIPPLPHPAMRRPRPSSDPAPSCS